MPWNRNQPSHPKYRSAEHRRERARLEREMQTQGYLTCAQPVCVMPTRMIREGEPWHLGHDDTGTSYLGPVCAKCNVTDGARRGRARQDAPTRWAI